MTTLITKTVAKVVLVISLLYSINLFLVGANSPGGGFIGGVACVCGIGLLYVAYGYKEIRKIWDPDWHLWFGYGLLFASITAISPMLAGHNYFRSAFEFRHLTLAGIDLGEVELSSHMFFDLGVYFVVIGGLLFILTQISIDRSPEGKK